jgi:hypothetical protein
MENKYLAHERSVHDRRSIHVRLTEKGIKLRDSLTVMHQRHAEMLSRAALSADDLQATSVTLRRLERFWIRAADLVQRPPHWHRILCPRRGLFSLDARVPTRWLWQGEIGSGLRREHRRRRAGSAGGSGTPAADWSAPGCRLVLARRIVWPSWARSAE